MRLTIKLGVDRLFEEPLKKVHASSRSDFDAVDGSSTGIAMCHIALAVQTPPTSANGT